jgi:gamma-glutamylaminecyclotransferase
MGKDTMLVLVIGSALREVCGDQAALGLEFVAEARTAPRYRLYSLEDRWAALVPVDEGGISVPGELVELPETRWEEILATEPPGITPGPVELADGRMVTAALGDPGYLEEHGRDITEHGGFAAYLRSTRPAGG